MIRTMPITTFAREYATLLEQTPDDDFLLERRAGAPVLVRPLREARADREVAQDLAVMLRSMLGHLDVVELLNSTLDQVYPWAVLLPPDIRSTFTREAVQTLRGCAALGRFGAYSDLLDSWKATAEVYADPDLARRLTGPVDLSGPPVPAPDTAAA
jgi:hypothetical protein